MVGAKGAGCLPEGSSGELPPTDSVHRGAARPRRSGIDSEPGALASNLRFPRASSNLRHVRLERREHGLSPQRSSGPPVREHNRGRIGILRTLPDPEAIVGM